MTKKHSWNRQVVTIAALSLASCSAPEGEDRGSPAESPGSVQGKAPAGTGAFPSIVLLEPEVLIETSAPSEPALMDQYGTAFHPKVLLVRPGQPVEFKNSEDVLHNVHVIDMESRDTEFNVGTPVVGSYRHRFAREGVYDVSCEIHPSMAALVVVTSAPFATIADSQGNFELTSVPKGSYRVKVWNLDPGRRRDQRVEIEEGGTRLELSEP